MDLNDEGYFLIALGKYYVNLVLKFIESKEQFNDKRKVCILVNPEDAPILQNKIDTVVSYNPTTFIEKYNLKHHHEIYGALPKVKVMNFSPFRKTIHVDADCFFVNDPQKLWDILTTNNRYLGITGLHDSDNSGPKDWHWNHLREVEETCGFKIPQTSGGVVYFDRDHLSDYNEITDHYILNYEEYNIKRWFNKDSFDDEIFYAIYMAIHGIRPYHYDEWKIQQIPSYKGEPINKEYLLYHDFLSKTR